MEIGIQGRFSRIFELLNQRNTEYYKAAFSKLEKENKTTFNFAAGFFPILWLVFRKMYGWAMLLILANSGILGILYVLCRSSSTRNVNISIFWLILFVGFGFFGNSLYYKHVKSKVTKGYAEISDYNPVDPIWSLLYSVLGSLLNTLSIPFLVLFSSAPESVINNLSSLFNLIIIAIVWTVDYRRFHSQKSIEPLAVTEESINRYLEKSDLKQIISAICAFALINVLSIMSLAFP